MHFPAPSNGITTYVALGMWYGYRFMLVSHHCFPQGLWNSQLGGSRFQGTAYKFDLCVHLSAGIPWNTLGGFLCGY
jgi:hypothetical protein